MEFILKKDSKIQAAIYDHDSETRLLSFPPEAYNNSHYLHVCVEKNWDFEEN